MGPTRGWLVAFLAIAALGTRLFLQRQETQALQSRLEMLCVDAAANARRRAELDRTRATVPTDEQIDALRAEFEAFARAQRELTEIRQRTGK